MRFKNESYHFHWVWYESSYVWVGYMVCSVCGKPITDDCLYRARYKSGWEMQHRECASKHSQILLKKELKSQPR